MNRRLVLAGVATSVASLAGCLDLLGNRVSRTTESTFDVPDGTPLAVAVENGTVAVEPHDRSGVAVTAEVRGPSEEAIRAVEVVTVEADGEFLVTEQVEEGTESVSVSLTVEYPRDHPLGRVETGNGTLDAVVTTVADDALLRTGNGTLDAALDPSLDATVEASTGNGTVDVDGLDFTVDESAGTASGTLGDGSKALTLRTDNGTLTVSSHPV